LTEGALYCDGASFGNPGPSGIGVVLEIGDEVVEHSEDIGWGTNNEAEYRALITGLRMALDRGVDVLHVRADSQLIVRQVTGEYKIKKKELQRLALQARSLVERFASVKFEHVLRDLNERADALSKAGAEHAKARGVEPPDDGLIS
jgi:ribonuclease HI/probable phosphoglycerate mutase